MTSSPAPLLCFESLLQCLETRLGLISHQLHLKFKGVNSGALWYHCSNINYRGLANPVSLIATRTRAHTYTRTHTHAMW